MLDAISATIAALKTKLEAALPAPIANAGAQSLTQLGTKVVEGWPQPEVALAYPTAAVHVVGSGNRIRHAPTMIQRVDPVSPTEPLFDAYFSVGTLELPVQIEVFASSWVQRAKILKSLEATLQADLVDGSATLELTTADYFNRAIAYWVEGPPRLNDTPGRVLSHEWHATLSLGAELDEIVVMKATRLLELRSATVIWVEGTVPPPAEQRTIFSPA